MNSIKYHLIYFLIFVHNKYIIEDFECFNPIFVNICLKPAWFVKSILKWIIIILFFPISFGLYYYDEKIQKFKNEFEKARLEVITKYFN